MFQKFLISSWNIQVDLIQMSKRLEQAIKKKPMTANIINVCNTFADPDSKRMRLNLVGLIHEKTKCVLYCKNGHYSKAIS